MPPRENDFTRSRADPIESHPNGKTIDRHSALTKREIARIRREWVKSLSQIRISRTIFGVSSVKASRTSAVHQLLAISVQTICSTPVSD